MNLNGGPWRYLMRYFDLQRKFWFWYESSEVKWCILTLFVTYARRLLGIREGITPLPHPFIVIAKMDFLFFSFFEMKSRPGPTGSIGATPVVFKNRSGHFTQREMFEGLAHRPEGWNVSWFCFGRGHGWLKNYPPTSKYVIII